MKYIKKFENDRYYSSDSQKLEGYNGKILINIPSATYFKSAIRFQIVFVHEVYKHKLIFKDAYGEDRYEYQVLADNIIRCNSDDSIDFTYRWDQAHNEDGFKRLKFITVEQFYNQHTDVFIGLLEEAIEESNNTKFSEQHRSEVKKIIDRMTIPETEHIIGANKYNL